MRISKKSLLQCVLIFIMVNFSGSYIYKKNDDLFLILCLIVSLYFFFKFHLWSKIKNDVYQILILTLGCFLTFLYTKGSLSIGTVINVFCNFFFVIVTINLVREKFIKNYCATITIVATFSLLFFLIQIIKPSLLIAIMPIKSGYYYSNILYTYAILHPVRNCGFMTEPGLYQVSLNVALFFVLFCKGELHITERMYRFVLFILLLTILSNQSTVGMINTFVLICFFLIDRNRKYNNKNVKTYILLIILFVGMYIALFDTSIIGGIIDKLFSDGQFNINADTGYYRMISMETDLKILKNNIGGVGYDRYGVLFQANKPALAIIESSSCGLSYFPAVFGISNFFILIYIYISKARRSQYGKICSLALFLIWALTGWTQPILYYTPYIAAFFSISKAHDSTNKFLRRKSDASNNG